MQQDIPENFGVAAVDAVIINDLAGAGASLMDGMLTSVVSGSLMENIPGVGVFFALAKTGFAIRDRIFLNKLGRFLIELETVPLIERQEFVKEINEDPNHKRKVGENLILLLEKLDDVQKASLIGRFFGFYVQKLISYDVYRRYVLTIDRAHIPDLEALVEVSGVEDISLLELDRTQMGALHALGISYSPFGVQLEPSHRDYNRLGDDKSTTTIWLTEMGKSFRELLMRIN